MHTYYLLMRAPTPSQHPWLRATPPARTRAWGPARDGTLAHTPGVANLAAFAVAPNIYITIYSQPFNIEQTHTQKNNHWLPTPSH